VDEMHGEKHNIFLERDGISAFVFPIMIPVSCRVEKASIDALYQTLLLMTATYPGAKPGIDVFPKYALFSITLVGRMEYKVYSTTLTAQMIQTSQK